MTQIVEDGEPGTFRYQSSGSAERPKTIERTAASWIESFLVAAERWHRGSEEIVAVAGRLGHSLSLYGALEALCLGAQLHLLGGMRPDRAFGRISEARITLLYATPTQVRLMAHAAPSLAAARSVRLVLVGGARLDTPTRQMAAGMFPNARIAEFYGSSETSFVAIADDKTPAGSVGRAFPGVSVELRDPGGAVVPAGTVGEIWASSPYLFRGYVGAVSSDTRWSGSFLSVGDEGWLDAEGYLYVRGRKGRVVTVADQNVVLDDVEAVVMRQPGVAEAAVVPLPEGRRGHRLVAFVRPAGAGCCQGSIRAACRGTLGPASAPKEVVTIEALPLLPSGKTDYGALLRRLKGGMA